jgi:hypothetical protein
LINPDINRKHLTVTFSYRKDASHLAKIINNFFLQKKKSFETFSAKTKQMWENVSVELANKK